MERGGRAGVLGLHRGGHRRHGAQRAPATEQPPVRVHGVAGERGRGGPRLGCQPCGVDARPADGRAAATDGAGRRGRFLRGGVDGGRDGTARRAVQRLRGRVAQGPRRRWRGAGDARCPGRAGGCVAAHGAWPGRRHALRVLRPCGVIRGEGRVERGVDTTVDAPRAHRLAPGADVRVVHHRVVDVPVGGAGAGAGRWGVDGVQGAGAAGRRGGREAAGGAGRRRHADDADSRAPGAGRTLRVQRRSRQRHRRGAIQPAVRGAAYEGSTVAATACSRVLAWHAGLGGCHVGAGGPRYPRRRHHTVPRRHQARCGCGA